jgi:L-lactate dehydrogenase (cytochrome)
VYISSAGLGNYAHPQAECTLAIGAVKEGLTQLIPTSPSMSLEAIANARINKTQPQFFQLYVIKDHEKARALIKRVEKLGVSALWITVDSPVLGKREGDDRVKSAVRY